MATEAYSPGSIRSPGTKGVNPGGAPPLFSSLFFEIGPAAPLGPWEPGRCETGGSGVDRPMAALSATDVAGDRPSRAPASSRGSDAGPHKEAVRPVCAMLPEKGRVIVRAPVSAMWRAHSGPGFGSAPDRGRASLAARREAKDSCTAAGQPSLLSFFFDFLKFAPPSLLALWNPVAVDRRSRRNLARQGSTGWGATRAR
jgi:hypothetical protein